MEVPMQLLVLLPTLLAGLLSCPGAVASAPVGANASSPVYVVLSAPPDCEKYGVIGCPRHYDPVCGTDGETYSNECVLCFSNRENKKDVRISNKGQC